MFSCKSGSIRENLFIFEEKLLYSGKIVAFDKKRLNSEKVLVFGEK